MAAVLPSSMKKLVVRTLSSNFREAIELQTVPLPKVKRGQILVRNRYVGINASDVNFTAGKYMPGVKPPFDAGFEAVGEVIKVGEDVPDGMTGNYVAHMTNGAFAEYQAISSRRAFPVKALDPGYLPCLVSGMTARLALKECGFLKPGDKVVVTAAAGGTGQFAVQLAKLAGCHVIGTCSTDEKVNFLRSIGCDHPINVSKQDLNSELKREYPGGVDVVYESVGGDTYEICVNRLAEKGRLIVIGYISGYLEPMGVGSTKSSRSAASLPIKLLMKSASVRGFFLFHFADQWSNAFGEIAHLYEQGKLTCAVDQGQRSPRGGFVGMEAVVDAVDYLYSKKNVGKVVVDLTTLDDKSKL